MVKVTVRTLAMPAMGGKQHPRSSIAQNRGVQGKIDEAIRNSLLGW
jgi:hypothetical protein